MPRAEHLASCQLLHAPRRTLDGPGSAEKEILQKRVKDNLDALAALDIHMSAAAHPQSDCIDICKKRLDIWNNEDMLCAKLKQSLGKKPVDNVTLDAQIKESKDFIKMYPAHDLELLLDEAENQLESANLQKWLDDEVHLSVQGKGRTDKLGAAIEAAIKAKWEHARLQSAEKELTRCKKRDEQLGQLHEILRLCNNNPPPRVERTQLQEKCKSIITLLEREKFTHGDIDEFKSIKKQWDKEAILIKDLEVATEKQSLDLLTKGVTKAKEINCNVPEVAEAMLLIQKLQAGGDRRTQAERRLKAEISKCEEGNGKADSLQEALLDATAAEVDTSVLVKGGAVLESMKEKERLIADLELQLKSLTTHPPPVGGDTAIRGNLSAASAKLVAVYTKLGYKDQHPAVAGVKTWMDKWDTEKTILTQLESATRSADLEALKEAIQVAKVTPVKDTHQYEDAVSLRDKIMNDRRQTSSELDRLKQAMKDLNHQITEAEMGHADKKALREQASLLKQAMPSMTSMGLDSAAAKEAESLVARAEALQAALRRSEEMRMRVDHWLKVPPTIGERSKAKTEMEELMSALHSAGLNNSPDEVAMNVVLQGWLAFEPLGAEVEAAMKSADTARIESAIRQAKPHAHRDQALIDEAQALLSKLNQGGTVSALLEKEVDFCRSGAGRIPELEHAIESVKTEMAKKSKSAARSNRSRASELFDESDLLQTGILHEAETFLKDLKRAARANAQLEEILKQSMLAPPQSVDERQELSERISELMELLDPELPIVDQAKLLKSRWQSEASLLHALSSAIGSRSPPDLRAAIQKAKMAHMPDSGAQRVCGCPHGSYGRRVCGTVGYCTVRMFCRYLARSH